MPTLHLLAERALGCAAFASWRVSGCWHRALGGVLPAKPVRGSHQRVGNARLGCGVAGVRHHYELCLGPGLVEFPGSCCRGHHIISALNDDARNLPQLVCVLQQLRVALKKSPVHEIMTFDPSKGEGEVINPECENSFLIRDQRQRRTFPLAPGAGTGQLLGYVLARQPTVVGRQKVVPLLHGNWFNELLPGVRKELIGSLLVEPLNLAAPQGEDAPQDQFGHPVRMGFGIGERQSGTPGSTGHLPAPNAKVLAKALHVGNQVPRGVVAELRMGGRLATAALVEQNDPISVRIMHLAKEWRDSATRPAVQHYHWFSSWIAALFKVDFVTC